MASETRHVCGLMGFNPMKGDNCPACETPHPPREAPTPDLDAKTLSVNEVNQMFAYAFERLRASGSGTTTAVEAMPKIVKSAPAVGEPFVCAHGTWTRPHVIRCNVCWDAQSSGTTTAGAPEIGALLDAYHDAVAEHASRLRDADESKLWTAASAARAEVDAALSPLMGDAALGRAVRMALGVLHRGSELRVWRSSSDDFYVEVHHTDGMVDAPEADALAALLSSPPGPSEARE
jgi:hypothetical protein